MPYCIQMLMACPSEAAGPAQIQHVRRDRVALGDIDQKPGIGELRLANAAALEHRRRVIAPRLHEVHVQAHMNRSEHIQYSPGRRGSCGGARR
jgi:hypothetical protein